MVQGRSGPVLALDLGGTKIVAGVVLPSGQMVSRNYCLTLADKGPQAVVDRLVSAANKAVAQARVRTAELAGIGVAAAGILDSKEGIITTSPNLPRWDAIPLRDILAEKLGVAIYLINDGSAAALGEHRFGVGKGVSNLVCLTVGTGIGGGIVIGGEVYAGTDGCAGEPGHMTVEAEGPQCNCGNFGCLEMLASGKAVATEAVMRLMKGEESSIVELAEGGLEGVTAKTVALAARQGDYLAGEIVAKVARYLGIGLANLVNIFNPELVIVGGGVSRMGNRLLEPARRVVKERAFQLPAQTVRIVRSRLGNKAGIMGAAAYVLEQEPPPSLKL